MFFSKHRRKASPDNEAKPEKEKPSTDLTTNTSQVAETLGHSTDLSIQTFHIGNHPPFTLALIYIDGLIDKLLTHNLLIETLLQEANAESNSLQTVDQLQDMLSKIGKLSKIKDKQTLLLSILSGKTVILLDGLSYGWGINTQGGEDRGVTEPSSQTVIRGPRDGFSETLRTNTALIRKRIKDPSLWMETFTIGEVTHTDVAIMYVKGIVNDKIVAEVKKRLGRIKIDGILESGYLEELIEDNTYSPFPTVYNTERPDVVAANLLEGRVAILVDGTPFVLVVPSLFVQFYQSAEDYYQRWDFATAIRFLRLISFLIALLAPAIYIAVTTFHHEMMPPVLLVSIASQREGVPFPAFIEALMMETSFEILREAGIRMPRAIGQAISIVGTLVVGMAAVEAGLVSAATVIVVSITAISNFASPSFNISIPVRLMRFDLMAQAASFGLFGITMGMLAIVVYLCNLRSFGIPYMSPLAPYIQEDQKDSIWRLPQWNLRTRPRLINQEDVRREPYSQEPKPPRE